MQKELPTNQCKRCGNCCIDVGRTWWKNGNYEGVNAALNDLARNGDHEDGGKPCEMLRFQDGKAVCQIHELWGYEAKPQVCKDHEGDERCSQVGLFSKEADEKDN